MTEHEIHQEAHREQDTRPLHKAFEARQERRVEKTDQILSKREHRAKGGFNILQWNQEQAEEYYQMPTVERIGTDNLRFLTLEQVSPLRMLTRGVYIPQVHLWNTGSKTFGKILSQNKIFW